MKVTISKQFQAFIQGVGIQLDDLLERASIPNVLWKEELELSPGDYVKFLGELDKDITDEQILAFSEVKNINNFMPPFFVALCAKNSREAFHRFGLYKQLIC
ncbi:AraC family transcriptional regulator, partial [Lactobacillus sp. XV13L]|nr:AraC family transcriptional regulator [Lactobacillus sp. XV13L]